MNKLGLWAQLILTAAAIYYGVDRTTDKYVAILDAVAAAAMTLSEARKAIAALAKL